MKTLEFSEQEATVLVNLLDAAVRAQGLGVAQNALALAQKVQGAFAPEEKKEEPKKK